MACDYFPFFLDSRFIFSYSFGFVQITGTLDKQEIIKKPQQSPRFFYEA